jgi:drug/metabolite transporter (DMT)-like permease
LAYLPILLGLATAICWGSSDYLSRRQSEKVGNYRTVVYSHVTTLFFLVVIVSLLQPAVTVVQFPVFILAVIGLVNFLAFIFLYRAFHKGIVSVVAPVAYTYPAWTAVLSVLILGTSLSQTTALGISAVIVGIVLLSTRFSELRLRAKEGSMLKLTAGLWQALLASFFFGLVYVGVGYATPVVGYALPPVLMRTVATLAGFGLAPILGQSIRPTRESLSNTVVAMGLLEAIGFISFNYGISLGTDSLPVVAALSGMGGAVAVLYAIYFLRERLERNQLLGIVISFIGVFTLLYLGG